MVTLTSDIYDVYRMSCVLYYARSKLGYFGSCINISDVKVSVYWTSHVLYVVCEIKVRVFWKLNLYVGCQS